MTDPLPRTSPAGPLDTTAILADQQEQLDQLTRVIEFLVEQNHQLRADLESVRAELDQVERISQ